MEANVKEKFDPLKFEGVTGWDVIGIDLAIEDGVDCIVIIRYSGTDGELWREDMGVYYGKVRRKERTNEWIV